jgi:hypothetical protein
MQLDVGSQIYFNATIVGQGDKSHLHHLHAFGIKKGEGITIFCKFGYILVKV